MTNQNSKHTVTHTHAFTHMHPLFTYERPTVCFLGVSLTITNHLNCNSNKVYHERLSPLQPQPTVYSTI